MKTKEEITIAHSYYKALADVTLAFLRANVLDESTHGKEEILSLNSRFRNKQYALEFVIPELKENFKEKIIQGIMNVHNDNLKT